METLTIIVLFFGERSKVPARGYSEYSADKVVEVDSSYSKLMVVDDLVQSFQS